MKIESLGEIYKKYFQKEYLSEHYYDKKMEEFFEFKLGSMTMKIMRKDS